MSRGDAVRMAVLAVLALAASAIGVSTYDPTIAVAVVFPASGVAVAWLTTTSRAALPYDALALAVTTVVGALLVGVTLDTAAMAAVVTVSHGLVAHAVVWRLLGGPIRLTSLRAVAVFLGACAAGAVVSAGLRGLGLGLLPPPAPTDTALTALRNLSWSLGLGAVLVLLIAASSSVSALRRQLAAVRWSSAFAVEAVAVVGATGWVVTLMLGEPPRALGFALMFAVIWSALRTPSLIAVGFAFMLGSLTLLATLDRHSVFAASGRSALQAAVVAQAFLVSLVLAALVISVGTQERRAATERAQVAELEASDRAALLAAVLEHLSEGVSVITEDQRYSVHNPAAIEMTGRGGFLEPDPSDPDQPVMVASSGEPLTPAEMPHARALASGVGVVREVVRVRTGRGAVRLLEISSSPVAGGEGRTMIVNTIRDVTREHEERDQLVGFAGVVAHDLKNPLTVIQGWSESLQEELAADGPPDVPALRSMIERVQNASDQMTSFIDDLLDITVTRDRPLDIEPLDLSALANEVAELRRTGDTQARIAVQPGMAVTGDRFLVRQLLDNLIGNAVKYVAPDVRPTVTVAADDRGEELEISITDNGVGIPVESRKLVFDSFVRAHGTAYPGTGLGLAICARVVSRHGGRIWMAEHEGPGTRVSFTLPRGEPFAGGSPAVGRTHP